MRRTTATAAGSPPNASSEARRSSALDAKVPSALTQQWDLGHDDYNPAIERPEHRECNRAAPNRLLTSREW